MRSLIVFFLFATTVFGQAFNPVAKEREPASIRQLPPDVRLDLAKQKCFIPKYKGATSREDEGYAMGHFRSGVSVDYAVVCHILARKLQTVLVYSNLGGAWKGETIIDSEPFDPASNTGKCEANVYVASPAYILEHARAHDPEELKRLPKLDHEGVNVWLCEKASVVYYFRQGTWLQLVGAD